jgi:hypothetical protein
MHGTASATGSLFFTRASMFLQTSLVVAKPSTFGGGPGGLREKAISCVPRLRPGLFCDLPPGEFCPLRIPLDRLGAAVSPRDKSRKDGALSPVTPEKASSLSPHGGASVRCRICLEPYALRLKRHDERCSVDSPWQHSWTLQNYYRHERARLRILYPFRVRKPAISSGRSSWLANTFRPWLSWNTMPGMVILMFLDASLGVAMKA